MDNVMKFYELLLMFDVNQDESTTISTVDKYKSIIENKKGSIDRQEDWGTMKLAYMINKNNKARYMLLNFQGNNDILDELTNLIKFNDSIIRHIFINQEQKITEPSIMMSNKERA
tara:strand:- start:405 stop:749 length:345 start_codon:yes stop_codon:yes gene_type:complete